MSNKGATFSVTFQPQGKSAQLAEGALLLDAAVKAGVAIDTPCGGQGRCGRCLVKVESGAVTHRENPHLTAQQIEQGWVLSCVARMAGDLVLYVPPQKEREKVVAETAAARSATPFWCDWPHYPLVRRFFLELPPPTLEDNATDLDRLSRSLEREHGIDNLSIGLPLMRDLAATLRQADWKVTATVAVGDKGQSARLIDLRPSRSKGPLLAIAVDIGTTNVVMNLVNLRSGRIIDVVSARNRQVSRGEDVISRIIYAERKESGLEELQRLAVETINDLVEELAQKNRFATTDIEEIVAAGNTTMLHLFLGLPPKHIREEPYVPTAAHFPSVTAGELGLAINPNASVYCLPAVAAYVGGDITAGVLSSCLYKADKLTLFLDVGTNGEIVLGNSDWMTACACSAGPAFEGAGVRSGMRAVKGAIEDVRINSKTLEPTIRVIGKVAPRGICGSGMISALAEMLITGVIDRAGHINLDYVNSFMKKSRARIGDHGPEYVLAWGSNDRQDVALTEVDIDNLIRAKAAIYGAAMVMMRSIGITLSDLEEVLIGGAFGQHVNVEQGIQIGLLPDLPWDRFKFLGNTSAWGAYDALLSKYAREEAEGIADKITYLELIADASFMNEFTAALFLPHTNIDYFPSVKALLEKQESKVRG